jgi:Mn2+/Fe2+ NRAMP family transporter
VILCFTPTTAIEELFWSAVINGVVAVPIMAVLMRLASRPDVMGEHVIGRRVRWLGWLATACMALPVIGLALTWKS